MNRAAWPKVGAHCEYPQAGRYDDVVADGTVEMAGQPFTLADLRTEVDAIYASPQWHAALARDLNLPLRVIKGWFDGKRLPDLRRELADLCRRNGADDPSMEKLARKLEKLGPPSDSG